MGRGLRRRGPTPSRVHALEPLAIVRPAVENERIDALEGVIAYRLELEVRFFPSTAPLCAFARSSAARGGVIQRGSWPSGHARTAPDADAIGLRH